MLAGRLFVEVTGAAVRHQDVLDCQSVRLSSQFHTAKNIQVKNETVCNEFEKKINLMNYEDFLSII